MYCHGLLSLLMVASVASLSELSNDPGTPPPPILVDNDARVERSSIYDEFAEGLYQGDIMLTEEQRRRLLSRKVIANSADWWPKSAGGGVDIEFRYADNTISRTGVQVAIDHWQAATCVRFHEITADVPRSHLIFTHSTTACNSNVGRFSPTAGQIINLTPSCIDGVGSAIHEIGHSLGLFHEQSRSDRDDYVYILSGNIDPTFSYNFDPAVDNNFSVPYDYSSVMHYGETFFSTNGKNTIVTKDFTAQPLIGQRADLSFMDIRIVNLLYKCIDEWLTACRLATDPCQNFGYTKSDCTCACPAGTSGVHCETLNQRYIDALKAAKSPNNQLVTTEINVTSPLFPAAIKTELAYVQVITAPPCNRVKITFNTFDFHPASLLTDGSNQCYFMTLEIRTDDPPIDGIKYCGTSIVAGSVFQSSGTTMVLSFTSHTNPGSYTGYTATVSFMLNRNPSCVTSESTTTPTTTTPTTTIPTTTTPITMTPTTTRSTTKIPTTTPSTRPGCTVTNSGKVPLLASLSGSCRLRKINAATYNLVSPKYPSRYGSSAACKGWFSTNEPRYVRVTPLALNIGTADRLSFTQVYHNETRVTNALKGGHLVFPTASAHLTFHAGNKKPGHKKAGHKFSFKMEVVNSKCHQIINITPGVTCTLSAPKKYPPGTICEWWIKAPPGKKVRVKFTRFSIGNKKCAKDFVAIDTKGNKRYASATRYCGKHKQLPGTVTSSGRQINILLNGRDGQPGGFDATYTVV